MLDAASFWTKEAYYCEQCQKCMMTKISHQKYQELRLIMISWMDELKIDVLEPYIRFNKSNTCSWYKVIT